MMTEEKRVYAKSAKYDLLIVLCSKHARISSSFKVLRLKVLFDLF